MKKTLTIKRIDASLPMPEYHSEGAAAFDLYSRVAIEIKPWQPTLIPLNLVVKIPPGHFLMVSARSSTARKFGLIVANGIGVIDEDYCGDADELQLSVLNFTKRKVKIKRGERLAQALLIEIPKIKAFKEVASMSARNRGGFGSTGHTAKTRRA